MFRHPGDAGQRPAGGHEHVRTHRRDRLHGHDRHRPAAGGETVVVSAAAGATGSVAGQIAKIAGARVVGIAGGPEKCNAVVGNFGFDACIDYKNEDVRAALKRHCPKGVDVYRQRRRADPRCRSRPARDEGAGGAVRGDLQLPHRRASRPGQLRQPAVQIGLDAGASTPWTCGSASRTPTPTFAAGRPRALLVHRETVLDGLELRRGAQRSVHRGQHRQDAGEGELTLCRVRRHAHPHSHNVYLNSESTSQIDQPAPAPEDRGL